MVDSKTFSDESFLVELIEEHRADGLSREAIAEELQVPFSEVKKLIKKHSIPKPLKSDSDVETVDSVPLSITDGISRMEQAKAILGRRMTEDYNGYRLDGMYSNTPAIIAAAGLNFRDET